MKPNENLRYFLFFIGAFAACLAEQVYVTFDDFNVCGVRTQVATSTEVFVTGQRTGGGGSTTSFVGCQILFEAAAAGQGLCLKVDQLNFINDNLQLNYYNSLDVHSTAPNQTFKSADGSTIPQEYCTTGREMALEVVEKTTGVGSITDVEMDLKVTNLQGTTTRVATMEQDCGVSYDLSDSQVTVLNRQSTSTSTPPTNCLVHFDYIGTNANNTLCLQFLRNSDVCGYELEIFDGTSSDFTPTNIIYSCSNNEPLNWCSSRKKFYLQLSRTSPSATEASSIFNVIVKDGTEGNIVFPTNDTPASGLSVGAIVGIVVAALVGLTLVVVIVLAATGKICNKGYDVPKNQRESPSL